MIGICGWIWYNPQSYGKLSVSLRVIHPGKFGIGSNRCHRFIDLGRTFWVDRIHVNFSNRPVCNKIYMFQTERSWIKERLFLMRWESGQCQLAKTWLNPFCDCIVLVGTHLLLTRQPGRDDQEDAIYSKIINFDDIHIISFAIYCYSSIFIDFFIFNFQNSIYHD